MRPVNLLPQEARRRPAGGARRQLLRGRRRARRAAPDGARLRGRVQPGHLAHQRRRRRRRPRPPLSSRQAAQQGRLRQLRPDQAAAPRERRARSRETRFDWERFMRELARIMPERSWIQTADASVSGDPTNTGAASAAAATGVAVEPTANLVGCTPGQTDTATMMVRLRKLYRVERREAERVLGRGRRRQLRRGRDHRRRVRQLLQVRHHGHVQPDSARH